MKLFITGGAGFIGTNAAAHFLRQNWEVAIYDCFARRGTEYNWQWLSCQGKIKLFHADIRDRGNLYKALADFGAPDLVLHLAGQVAVTFSVQNPYEDFEINVAGTLNLLEILRSLKYDPVLIYASTNKVYGGMEKVSISEDAYQYHYRDLAYGIPESYPLDFHSPYGCSKGAADQYIHDYARIYGMRSVVMRQSCIYGCHQFGMEDQGWIAWFIIASLLGRPLTLYGNGKQVRDVLFVEDLVGCYDAAFRNIADTQGEIFNIGGGPANTLSLLSLLDILQELLGRKLTVGQGDWRPGDQKVYISDIRRAKEIFGWEPEITPFQGIKKLWEWATVNQDLLAKALDGERPGEKSKLCMS